MASGVVDSIMKDDSCAHPKERSGCGFWSLFPKSIIQEDDGILGFNDAAWKMKYQGVQVPVCPVPLKKSPARNEQVRNCVLPKDFPDLNSKSCGDLLGDDESTKRAKRVYSGAGVRKSGDTIYGNADQYERLSVINGGTYGIVYRAVDKKTREIVAMKMEFQGLSVPTIREIDILRSLRGHPSIVEFKQVVADKNGGVYVVMEYLECDLLRYMRALRRPLSPGEVKGFMKQLLEGVKFIHDTGVMHRDLKPSNILMNAKGSLKICDFGLSRRLGSMLELYTPGVVTLWYRAPELLFGTRMYSSAIDMWSVGCIMAELLLGKPLFRGATEIGQLDHIFGTLGTPNETVWPGFSSFPASRIMFATQPYNLLRKKFAAAASSSGAPVITELGLDLLNKFLTYDPNKRITAAAALNHGWFRESQPSHWKANRVH